MTSVQEMGVIGLIGYGEVGKIFAAGLLGQPGVAGVSAWDLKFDQPATQAADTAHARAAGVAPPPRKRVQTQASAVAMLCAARRGIPVALHTPSEVKAAVTGSGRADKAQVGAMVTRLLRLAAPPKPADAADALALAICHIWRAPAQNRLQQAVALHTAHATKGRTA